MKKMNSTSKRKWILGGALAFGGVALLTTGFATWIVGVQKTQTEGEVGVTVDTVQDSSVEITATLSDAAITIADKLQSDGPAVKVPEAAPDTLKITFSEVKVTYGAEFETVNGAIKGLKFSLPYAADTVITDIKDNASLLVPEANNKLGTDRTVEAQQLESPAGKYWTYLEAPDNVAATSGQKDDDKHTLTFTNLEVEFKYGTFFGNKGPAEFYNEVYKDKPVTTTVVENIKEELTTMSGLFDNGIKLVVALDYGK